MNEGNQPKYIVYANNLFKLQEINLLMASEELKVFRIVYKVNLYEGGTRKFLLSESKSDYIEGFDEGNAKERLICILSKEYNERCSFEIKKVEEVKIEGCEIKVERIFKKTLAERLA